MARAFHRGYVQDGRRAQQVTRLHIIREDGKWAGKQGLCGTSAARHQKSEPPSGLRWCPACVGQLAERLGVLDRFAGELAGLPEVPMPAG
jgi:hypothetical protein